MNKLQKELRAAGARADELDGLVELAAELHVLQDDYQSFWHKYRPTIISLATGMVLFMAIVLSAQTSLPGSILYPVKRTSEQAVLTVKPSYRGAIMMRRAQEVQQLVDAHADTATVLATLADYRTEAVLYKTGSTSYAVYDSCTKSLKTAARHTTGSEQAAIKHTLYSLDAS